MLSKSKTSPRGASPSAVSAKTATGFRKGCNDSAQESLRSAFAIFSPDSTPTPCSRYDKVTSTHKGNLCMSDFPLSTRFPVELAVCAPEACSECVTYILSELCPILSRFRGSRCSESVLLSWV